MTARAQKKKRRRAEVRARSAAIVEARKAQSLNLVYGEGFLQGACGGSPPAEGIEIYGSVRAARDQYKAGFMDGRRIRNAGQAAAR